MQPKIGLYSVSYAGLWYSGRPLTIKEFIDKATTSGVWLHYVVKDPLTGKDEPKSSWVVRHRSYIFGCGVYSPAS